MLSFIGFFCVSFFGILLLEKFDKRSIKEYVIIYPVMVVIVNSICLLVCRLRYGFIESIQYGLDNDMTLFVRYCIWGLISVFVMTLIFIVLSNKVELKLINEKKNE